MASERGSCSWADYHQIDTLAAWAQRAGLHGVCIEHFLLSPALIAPLLVSGLSVTSGTINHAALLEPLLALGLDAVTSDRPHELRAELRSRRDTSLLAA